MVLGVGEQAAAKAKLANSIVMSCWSGASLGAAAVAMAKVSRCDEDSNYRRDDAEQQATDHGGAVAAQIPRLVHLWEEASVEERFHERAVRKESDEGGNGAAEGAEQAAVRNWELRGGGFADMCVASLVAVACMAGLAKPLVHPTKHVKPAWG